MLNAENMIPASPFESSIRYAFKKLALCEVMINNRFNDFLLNIETGVSASGLGARQGLPNARGIYTDKATYNDNIEYEPAHYRFIARMMQVLAMGKDDVFYDIGCGKGRILCMAARWNLKRVVGVELFDELCIAARQNAERLRGRKAPIDVICSDATRVDYSDGTVFTFYNPFGEATMRAVIRSIREAFHRNPRSIRIGYLNSLHECVLAEEPWLERYACDRTMSRNGVSFWRSIP